jgi:hypothetical protein
MNWIRSWRKEGCILSGTLMTVRHEGGSVYRFTDQPCCTRDEGRPLGAAVQAEAPNRLKLLWSKAMVVSVKEKARQDLVR